MTRCSARIIFSIPAKGTSATGTGNEASTGGFEIHDNAIPRGAEHDRVERALLGSVLISGNVYPEAAKIVKRLHFASERHALIWDAIESLHSRAITPDLVTVICELDRKGVAFSDGNASYVAALVDDLPDVDNYAGYAKLTRDYSIIRRHLGSAA